VLREGVNRIDQHEGPRRDAVVDEVVCGLEFGQVESEGDSRKFPSLPPTRSPSGSSSSPSFPSSSLPSSCQGVSRDLRVVGDSSLFWRIAGLIRSFSQVNCGTGNSIRDAELR